MTSKPMPDPSGPRQPFSHPLHVSDVPEDGLDIAIEADAAERQALAVADGLPGIARLAAHFHVQPKGRNGFNISGEVEAKVTQICGVSLEPFESEFVEPVDVDFAPPAEAAEAAAAADMLSGGAAQLVQERDPPDPIIDGKIDLGALASEFLALGLDPYPRKPGVSFEPAPGQGTGAKEVEDSPFSALRKLKERGQ